MLWSILPSSVPNAILKTCGVIVLRRRFDITGAWIANAGLNQWRMINMERLKKEIDQILSLFLLYRGSDFPSSQSIARAGAISAILRLMKKVEKGESLHEKPQKCPNCGGLDFTEHPLLPDPNDTDIQIRVETCVECGFSWSPINKNAGAFPKYR